MDNAARINMLAREAGMSYGQYQAMLFEQRGYEPIEKQEEPEEKMRGEFCVICGKPIPGSLGNRAKTCRKACSYQLNAQRARERYRELHVSPVFEKTCIACGKNFKTAYKRQIFCSDRCRDHQKAKDYRARQRRMLESGEKTYEMACCAVCGKEFIKRYPHKKYCGEKCRRLSERMRKDG